MKKQWIRKGIMMAVFAMVALLFFTAVVMGLWNAILPAVLGIKTISFTQALGILVLSKILFGGLGGNFKGKRATGWRQEMKAKCEGMTVEERDQFKSEWRSRCGSRWGNKTQNTEAGKTMEQ